MLVVVWYVDVYVLVWQEYWCVGVDVEFEYDGCIVVLFDFCDCCGKGVLFGFVGD